jgi:hypothetical protein
VWVNEDLSIDVRDVLNDLFYFFAHLHDPPRCLFFGQIATRRFLFPASMSHSDKDDVIYRLYGARLEDCVICHLPDAFFVFVDNGKWHDHRPLREIIGGYNQHIIVPASLLPKLRKGTTSTVAYKAAVD